VTSPINTKAELVEFLAHTTGKELWAEFRRPNGDFTQWFHAWRMTNTESGYKLCFQYVTTPKPWLWKDRPDGELLIAYYNMGYFKSAPHPWPAWSPEHMLSNIGSGSKGTIYCALLSGVSNTCLQQYMAKLRSQVASDIDLMAMLDKHYRLFKETS
jgi:hypothetical protein